MHDDDDVSDRLAVFCVFSLMTDKVQMSASECNAVMSSLMECSHYCLSQCLTTDSDDTTLSQYIVTHIVSVNVKIRIQYA